MRTRKRRPGEARQVYDALAERGVRRSRGRGRGRGGAAAGEGAGRSEEEGAREGARVLVTISNVKVLGTVQGRTVTVRE